MGEGVALGVLANVDDSESKLEGNWAALTENIVWHQVTRQILSPPFP